jgi:hypothetical protein
MSKEMTTAETTGAGKPIPGMEKRDCHCAWMVCGHCRKYHTGPNGACTKCSCKGFI